MKAAFTTIIYSIWPLVDLHGMPDYIPGDNVAFHVSRCHAH